MRGAPQITLIYNSDKAEAIQNELLKKNPSLKAVDLTQRALTEKEIAELALKLGGNIEDLVDPAYDDHIRVHKEGLNLMNRKEMLALMACDSKVINTPILIVDNKVYNAASAYKMLQRVSMN